MSVRRASVSAVDLGLTLDYLEGFRAILGRLQGANGVGRVIADEFARHLYSLDVEDALCFDPLRYESETPGQGWQAVAWRIDDLRERLLAEYGNAAL